MQPVISAQEGAPVAAPLEPERLRARVILHDAGDDHSSWAVTFNPNGHSITFSDYRLLDGEDALEAKQAELSKTHVLVDACFDHAAMERADIYLPKERLVRVDQLMTLTKFVRVLAHCYATSEDG